MFDSEVVLHLELQTQPKADIPFRKCDRYYLISIAQDRWRSH
ncbi:MAG: hypothetical protein V7K68_29260 [Nostoc sp.]